MYVIFHIASTMQVGPTQNGQPHSLYAKMYKTLGSAARTAKKWNAKAGKTEYSACHVDDYRRNVVHMVTRVNYMTGKEYQEASNTPGHCSPSSEAYWSN